MSAVSEVAQSVDYTTLATNTGILLGFVIAAVAGVKKGLKILSKPETDRTGRASITEGMILENVTLNQWSESNRLMVDKLSEVKAALYHTSDTAKDHQQAIMHLAHQVERLRDKMG